MAGTEGLRTEIQYVKGVGPKNAMALAKINVKTAFDALWTLPKRYEDRRLTPKIGDVRAGSAVTLRGTLASVYTRPLRGGRSMIRATLSDETGKLNLTWFNQPWVARELKKVEGEEIVAFGTVREGKSGREISAPEWETVEEDEDAEDFAKLVPVYGLTEGVKQRQVRNACRNAAEHFASMLEDPLPVELRRSVGLPSLGWCVRELHIPEDDSSCQRARDRLAFEEFLYLQLALQMKRAEIQQEVGIAFPLDEIDRLGVAGGSLLEVDPIASEGESMWDQAAKLLPFEPTGAQRRVIDEVWRDMRASTPMNRLVQGDVGSGKTAVAACAMLGAVLSGYQSAMMAPTEILAEQHATNLRRMFEPLGVTVTLVVGKLNAANKRKALQAVEGGEARIVVGTHALIQEGVKFSRLGLAVIDEQHRFGVMQRATLRTKAEGNPDVLVMTATPIPRTLTMTLYGDLDVSVIDELPPGRKPIRTHWKRPNERDAVYETVRKLVSEGRQAYFVCPAISESDKLQARAAEDLHYRLSNETYPDLQVGLLHGQMKPAEKEEAMERFRRGETQVLVATVVIEVGVDVPNASVMVIEDANRFGLSQLHQLRGRVGRGSSQSYCVLIAEATNDEARRRLETMVKTNDGFEIAEVDLEIRGPGDMAGTRQSGAEGFLVANLLRDGALLERAKEAAVALLEDDPNLGRAHHREVLRRVRSARTIEALVSVS